MKNLSTYHTHQNVIIYIIWFILLIIIIITVNKQYLYIWAHQGGANLNSLIFFGFSFHILKKKLDLKPI